MGVTKHLLIGMILQVGCSGCVIKVSIRYTLKKFQKKDHYLRWSENPKTDRIILNSDFFRFIIYIYTLRDQLTVGSCSHGGLEDDSYGKLV